MAYEQVFSQGPMSMMDRIVAAGILEGQMSPPAGDFRADSPAGKKGIEIAMQIRQEMPELAASLASMAARDIDLIARQSREGLTTADVIAAGEQGAGVSPLPAVLAGTGVGGGTAALAALMRRRGGGDDPFQIKRKGATP